MDEFLRKEVGFLGTRLGNIVREHAGDRVFDAIENFRKLSKKIRQSKRARGRRLAALTRLLDGQVKRLNVTEGASVAHAFSLFFHLVNLAEERQRVRRLRAYEGDPKGPPISLRHTFGRLRRRRFSRGDIETFLSRVRVEPVLTAHPTEAKRRSVMNHILRIARTLDAMSDELGEAAERAVDPWVEALWLTDEIRQTAVTPEVEIENTLVYLERTIFDLAGAFWEHFSDELQRLDPRIDLPAPFIRFGSWVGTDRDGNPNVTPGTSFQAAAELRKAVLRYYGESCRRLLGLLSLPAAPALERQLRRSIERDMKQFPATRVFESMDQPNELYRRKLRIMIWRLERAAADADGAYGHPREFAADIALLRDMIEKHQGVRLARVGPGRLHVAAQVFGFHGASLDFRQHSEATRAAVDEILKAASLPHEPADARIQSAQRLLPRQEDRIVSMPTQRVLNEYAALASIQTSRGEQAAHRYILSYTTRAADIWDLVLLARQAKLVDCDRAGRLSSTIDLIPLFETFDDLHRCADILDELLSNSQYRGLLRSRGNFQEVMLGYSDSVKDSGYVAANWALFRAQEQLTRVADKHDVRLGLFHGKGGTIDRGGALSYRSVQAQPFAAPHGIMRITEQGEVISLKYSNPAIAQRNLEQLVTSVLDAHLIHRRPERDVGRAAEWAGYADELAATSRDYYTELVYRARDFPQYFYQATPIDLIERLRLGSRPPRRYRTKDIRALRAIPWVFAWTQSRHFLPAWYGLGHALDQFVATHRPRGLELLRDMYREWPFFAVLLDNAEVSLAKTDLYIAGKYAALVRPAELGRRIFSQVEAEFNRSRRFVLEITGIRELLDRQPVLAESIRLRNPYVDPLNFLQIHFLGQWRGSRNPSPELLHLLQITVGGVAFGMKSTG